MPLGSVFIWTCSLDVPFLEDVKTRNPQDFSYGSKCMVARQGVEVANELAPFTPIRQSYCTLSDTIPQ